MGTMPEISARPIFSAMANSHPSRRDLLRSGVSLGLGALVAPRLLQALDPSSGVPLTEAEPLAAAQGPLITRAIPSSGEKLPAIGIGTARRYDVTTAEEKAPLRDTLREFPKLGGRVIDTAPGYGQAEVVTGELVAGFWIWKCASLQEAIDWVKRCPNPMRGDSEIEIRQIFSAEDFGDALTPELKAQEERLRAQVEGKSL